MAAVSVPPSPRTSITMSTTRRTPLANVPNATNSPHRPSFVPVKRTRTVNHSQPDIPEDQPPAKKQAINETEVNARFPSRAKTPVSGPDSKVFLRRSNNAQPSAFEKRLVAVRDKDKERQMQTQTQTKGTRHEKASTETVDTIRQWQKHYRRAFPYFVFYFDSLPEETRNKCSRQVAALGAREEKFFSRVVTHIVTSRPIPRETDSASPTELNNVSVTDQQGNTLYTINPSMLDKSADAHLGKSLKNDARRDQSNTDVLYRARRMGMKIWAYEKLQRMIATINDEDAGGYHGNASRGQNDTASKARGDQDLTQVLKNELLNGPSDRDPLSSMKEIIYFRGPFIYVHDMDEKTKPVMVREFPKVAKNQDGIWPQFRSAPLGRCPFIDEPPSKKEMDRVQAYNQKKEKKAAAEAQPVNAKPNGNLDVSQHTTKRKSQSPKVEEGIKQEGNDEFVSPPEQPDMQSASKIKAESPRKSSESFIVPQVPRTGPFHTGREPAASGVQPSNITSAIRSQMVSSTAAAPGAKAGLSKEVHELKRKVLEKNNGGVSTGGISSSHRAADALATARTGNQSKTLGKMNPQEKPADRHEDSTLSEGKGTALQQWDNSKMSREKKREREREQERERQKEMERQRRIDPKPGYCENCSEKFNDFDRHTMTRKHRKFALDDSNWKGLDRLLNELHRPLKPGAYKYVEELTGVPPPQIRRSYRF